ncbi:hypothetical protein GGR56DRAFT_696208 [Xylariaceae sp. FL0804]|nr:hypothetical protein GGR56DRAFT_696208 [Xylariaceae sp. FL0804]
MTGYECPIKMGYGEPTPPRAPRETFQFVVGAEKKAIVVRQAAFAAASPFWRAHMVNRGAVWAELPDLERGDFLAVMGFVYYGRYPNDPDADPQGPAGSPEPAGSGGSSSGSDSSEKKKSIADYMIEFHQASLALEDSEPEEDEELEEDKKLEEDQTFMAHFEQHARTARLAARCQIPALQEAALERAAVILCGLASSVRDETPALVRLLEFVFDPAQEIGEDAVRDMMAAYVYGNWHDVSSHPAFIDFLESGSGSANNTFAAHAVVYFVPNLAHALHAHCWLSAAVAHPGFVGLLVEADENDENDENRGLAVELARACVPGLVADLLPGLGVGDVWAAAGGEEDSDEEESDADGSWPAAGGEEDINEEESNTDGSWP